MTLDYVHGPMTDEQVDRFLRNGPANDVPKMTDEEKESHRMKALQADHWAHWYAWKAQDADYPEERDFWKKREAHYRLECSLHLSLLEEDQ